MNISVLKNILETNAMNIRFMHYRNIDVFGTVMPNGGLTVAYYEEGDVIHYAIAQCSIRDNFCRRTGNVKAGGRLNSKRYMRQFHGSLSDFRMHMEDHAWDVYGFERVYRKTKMENDFGLTVEKVA